LENNDYNLRTPASSKLLLRGENPCLSTATFVEEGPEQLGTMPSSQPPIMIPAWKLRDSSAESSDNEVPQSYKYRSNPSTKSFEDSKIKSTTTSRVLQWARGAALRKREVKNESKKEELASRQAGKPLRARNILQHHDILYRGSIKDPKELMGFD